MEQGMCLRSDWTQNSFATRNLCFGLMFVTTPPSPDGSAFGEGSSESDLSWDSADENEVGNVLDTPVVWEYVECSAESPKGAFASVDPMELAFLTSCKISDEQDIPNYRVLRLVVMQNTLTALYSMWTPSENPAYEGLTDDERKNQSFADALNAMRVSALQIGPEQFPSDRNRQSEHVPDTKAHSLNTMKLKIPSAEEICSEPVSHSELPLIQRYSLANVELPVQPGTHKVEKQAFSENDEQDNLQLFSSMGVEGVKNMNEMMNRSPPTSPESENPAQAKNTDRSSYAFDSYLSLTLSENGTTKSLKETTARDKNSEQPSQSQESNASPDTSLSSDSKVFVLTEKKAVTQFQKRNLWAGSTVSDNFEHNAPVVGQYTTNSHQLQVSIGIETRNSEISKPEAKPAVVIPPRTYSRRTSQIIRESAKVSVETTPIHVLEPVEVVGKNGTLVQTFEKLWGDRLAGYVNMDIVTPPAVPRVGTYAEKAYPTRSDTIKTSSSTNSSMTGGSASRPFLSIPSSPSLLTLLDSHVDPSTVLSKLPRGGTGIDRRPSQLSVRSSSASGSLKRRATRNKPLPNLPPAAPEQNWNPHAAKNDNDLLEEDTRVKRRLSFVFDGLEKVMFDNVSIESVTEQVAHNSLRASAEPVYLTSSTSNDDWGESVLSLVMGSGVNRSSRMTATAKDRRIKKTTNLSDEPLRVLQSQHAVDSGRNGVGVAYSHWNGKTATIPVRSSSRVKSLDIDSAMARYKETIQPQDWLKQGDKKAVNK
ncbi:hypothetical protein HDU82_000408 [Entophlyctis luteolus]|nr:hypothetical protein HDU82_000408 [Entophlyctis luteolus]